MQRTKVFVSFDFDNDQDLKHLIVGQAKLPDSPFEITDVSLKEAQPEKDWEEKARAAIKRADVFLVVLGSRTRFASGVRKEVRIANELGKPRCQIIGRSHGTEDWAVADGGRTYRWTWDTLKKLLAPR